MPGLRNAPNALRDRSGALDPALTPCCLRSAAMDIKTLFGLPAHPLLVHVPVVLIPLAFVGACGMFWTWWRDRFGWATAVLLIVGYCVLIPLAILK